jgi:hypothetical protein
MMVKKKVREELKKLRDSSVDELYAEAQKRLDVVDTKIKDYEEYLERHGTLGSAHINYTMVRSERYFIIKDLKEKLLMRIILRLSDEGDI